MLHATASTGEVGRPIFTTPGVPPERLAALRSAFRAMVADPVFLAACEKRNLMIDGATGEEIDEDVRETLRLPQAGGREDRADDAIARGRTAPGDNLSPTSRKPFAANHPSGRFGIG